MAGAVLGGRKGQWGSALFFLRAFGIHRPPAMPGLGHLVILKWQLITQEGETVVA